MQRKRAFTLIELLVVIAIIAILAAILFPVFAKAREKAKQSQSVNNVKQLALGVIQYSSDYDETFPGWVTIGNTSYHNTWDEQINSQIKSTGVFTNGGTGIKSPSDPKKERVLSYGMNGALFGTVTQNVGSVVWTQPPAPLGPGQVTNPAETIMFAEVATDAAPLTTPNGAISRRPDVINANPSAGVVGDGQGASAWMSALPQAAGSAVIDISPRDWVTQGAAGDIPYQEATWNQAALGSPINAKGVARDLYSGGGIYGFVDGHVKFMKISESVGLGKKMSNGTDVTSQLAWMNSTAVSNPNNMWYPSR